MPLSAKVVALLVPVFFLAACKPSAMAGVTHDDPAAYFGAS